MHKIINNIYKKANIKFDSNKKAILIIGPLGLMEKTFNGNVILYYSKKIFFLTKADYQIFIKVIDRLYVGVVYGYFIEINFVGLGYRFLKLKNFLLLKLGFSHYIKYMLGSNLYMLGYKRKLILYGMNNIEVNLVARELQRFKQPNVYKGKGIQISGEILKYKIGKQK